MANWGDYQTAIQFVAGLNIALIGLPDLRQVGIAHEQRTEHDLVHLANRRGRFRDAVRFKNAFDNHWDDFSKKSSNALFSCLIVSFLTSVVLLRATGPWASQPANDCVAWGTIGIGFAPAAWLLVLNLRARTNLNEAKAIRLGMEQELATEASQKFSGDVSA